VKYPEGANLARGKGGYPIGELPENINPKGLTPFTLTFTFSTVNGLKLVPFAPDPKYSKAVLG
jgi:hypothetical protein